MEFSALALFLSFIAGLVSFISPCVLPLVPAYIGYMGGRTTHTVSTQLAVGTVGGTQQVASGPSAVNRFNTLIHGLFFVAGFAFVFVSLGLLLTAFVAEIGGDRVFLVRDIIGRVGGIVIIFFGLHFMGVLPSVFTRIRKNEQTVDNPASTVVIALVVTGLLLWAFIKPFIAAPIIVVLVLWLVLGGGFTHPGKFWMQFLGAVERGLYSDTRKQMTARSGGGYGSSAIMGVVFSAGWTPCIGPIYGAILTMAAGGGNVSEAGTMLAAYSLGLGIPFLATALLLDSAQNSLRKLQRQMRKVEVFSGSFLIVIGLLVASGSLQNLSERFAGDFAEFSIDAENFVTRIFGGEEVLSGTRDTPTTFDGLVIELENIAANDSVNDADAESATSLLNLAASAPPVEGLDLGNIAPNFETVLSDGTAVALHDLRGQVVALNFWATWCGPCRIEMPEFQSIFNEHGDDGFTILAVDNQESVEDVLGFAEEFELNFPLAMDERGDIQDQYGVFSYPSTYILDRNGVIIQKHFGPLIVSQIEPMVVAALNAPS